MSFLERLKIQKPNIEILKQDGFTPVDMHVHTKYSDGLNKIGTIVKKAYSKGFGLAITDHNTIKSSLKAIRLAQDISKKHIGKNEQILVIPGMEINSADGPHILTYFYDKDCAKQFYEKNMSKTKGVDPSGKSRFKIIDIIDAASEFNMIIGLAHPVGPTWTNAKKVFAKMNDKKGAQILKKIDAFEVLNGAMSRKSNMNAIMWNIELGKSIIGGGDGHSLGEIGNIFTYSKNNDVSGFLDAIIKHKSLVIGTENRIKKFVGITNSFRKHMRYMRPNIKMSIDYEINEVLKPIFAKKYFKKHFTRNYKDSDKI